MLYRNEVNPLESQLCLENCRRLQDLSDEVARETAANKEAHKEYERRFTELEESGKRQSEILVTLQKQADAIESMNGKIDTFSDKVDTKIDDMSERVENAVDRLDKRITDIEKEPGEKWKKISFEVIKYVVIAAVGAGVAFLSKGGI